MFSDYTEIKLEIKIPTRKSIETTWKLNNTFLKQSMDQRASCKENKNYTELNESENKAYQNLWDAAKVVLEENF